MNCPFCNKRIEAMTGLQEAIKFRKHLDKCRKNPEPKRMEVMADGGHKN